MPVETILMRASVARKPWRKRLNPLWWLGNDDTPTAPDWYRPGKRWRTLYWYLRNPLHNFTRYVIGFCDRDHYVTGRVPAAMVLRRDWNERGWQYALVWAGWLPLPFASYSGKHVTWYAGWRPGGDFGLKLNLS